MKSYALPSHSTLFFKFIFIVSIWLSAATVYGQQDFTLSFTPGTIGPGSISTLQYNIVNGDPTPILDVAFTNTLPANLTIAAPARASAGCGGDFIAPEGGTTISYTTRSLAANSSCTLKVDVTGAIPGTNTNITSDLTSSAGTTPFASGDLIINGAYPGFQKSFSPSTINLGDRSTLTFTLNNDLNPAQTTILSFVDNLPTGMVVADPANMSQTCNGAVLLADGGSNNISSTTPFFVPAQTSCELSVDVITLVPGTFGNTSGDLLHLSGITALNSGKAGAVLTVNQGALSLVKSFTDDPVVPGDTVTLEYVIYNLSRTDSATNISFNDDLDGILTGLAATGLPANDICGTGSSLSGSGVVTFSGGTLAPQGSCTFQVTLQTPPAAGSDSYLSTTSAISATVGGSPVIGSPASDALFVNTGPSLTLSYLADPVVAGSTVTLTHTITNNDTTFPVSNITFEYPVIETLTIQSLPSAGSSCGATSTFSTYVASDVLYIVFGGGEIPAGGSCTFDTIFQIPVTMVSGTYSTTTTAISGEINATLLSGKKATDSLSIIGVPTLTNTFIDNPVQPGDTVSLSFTITSDQLSPVTTNISFTDDLTQVAPGLAATNLPLNNICGNGSSITGTTNLSFTNGSLNTGQSCTFTVDLQVPANTVPGTYQNMTSALNLTVNSITTTSPAATAQLTVSPLHFTKSFTDDPVIPGDTVTLEYTISNNGLTDTATNILFTEQLSFISGLTPSNLPLTDPCGTGSQFIGAGSTLILIGGTLAPQESCTFSVDLAVPVSTPSDSYFSLSSALSATINAVSASGGQASDTLIVDSNLLALEKTFLSNPVLPGDTVDLQFTVTNLDTTTEVIDLTFTDDLDQALSGLIAVTLPSNGFCGTNSELSGTSTLTFSSGTLGPGESCSFSATLQVPTGVADGTIANNTTSSVSGNLNGLPVQGSPATDDLQISTLSFIKEFSGVATAGGTVSLNFTIENHSSTQPASDLAFFDDLGAMFQGIVATNLPLDDICGAGSQISGTSIINLTGGILQPSTSCTIPVTLQLPETILNNTYLNTTSQLMKNWTAVVEPATAYLTVVNDTDNDGIPDYWEIAHGLNPLDPSDGILDPDGDGISNIREYYLKTDPHIFDADLNNNGLPDSYEKRIGLGVQSILMFLLSP